MRGGEGRCRDVWWVAWKSVLGCKGSLGIGVGKCVEMWGKMWESFEWVECGEICWGVGR